MGRSVGDGEGVVVEVRGECVGDGEGVVMEEVNGWYVGEEEKVREESVGDGEGVVVEEVNGWYVGEEEKVREEGVVVRVKEWHVDDGKDQEEVSCVDG